MTRDQLIQLLCENLEADDEIVVEKDGGEYWGSYLEEPRLEVQTARPYLPTVGHPGAPGKVREVESKKVLVLK